MVTNLRIIWTSHADPKVNLSVGLNTILAVNIRKAKSKLRGSTQALCVMAKFSSRFEFIFTSLVKNSPRLFTTVQAVMRAYETSKLYRELKLRGSIMKDGSLQLLPDEQIVSKYNGIWNLSNDQGNLGTFYFTNVRVVWHADLAANFNVSLPYMQIKGILLRNQTKFGKALVIETFSRAGGYILGFRIDPESALVDLEKELVSLFRVYSVTPIFGVDFAFEDVAPSIEQLTVPRIEEDIEIINDNEDTHAVAAYYADESAAIEGGDQNLSVQYDPRLGLAIEGLPPGMNTETLWRVL